MKKNNVINNVTGRNALSNILSVQHLTPSLFEEKSTIIVLNEDGTSSLVQRKEEVTKITLFDSEDEMIRKLPSNNIMKAILGSDAVEVDCDYEVKTSTFDSIMERAYDEDYQKLVELIQYYEALMEPQELLEIIEEISVKYAVSYVIASLKDLETQRMQLIQEAEAENRIDCFEEQVL